MRAAGEEGREQRKKGRERETLGWAVGDPQAGTKCGNGVKVETSGTFMEALRVFLQPSSLTSIPQNRELSSN